MKDYYIRYRLKSHPELLFMNICKAMNILEALRIYYSEFDTAEDSIDVVFVCDMNDDLMDCFERDNLF